MFNVGGPEIMVILLVALVVLGPQQLPKAMRTFGSVMTEVRKVSSGFQAEMRAAMNASETTETTGSEKPQSASMEALEPEGGSTAGESAHIEEVVAKNPTVDDSSTAEPGAAPEQGGAPAIDPADRAAG